jgi:hypothetical protein
MAGRLNVAESHRNVVCKLNQGQDAYISDLKQLVADLALEAKRYRWLRDAGSRSHSPHMDGTMCYEVRKMLNGRHESFDAAIDAAMEESREPSL